MFLGKGAQKIFSKFTEHPCRSAISVKFQSNFIGITLPYGCSPVNLLHIFRTSFPKNTSGRLLLIKIFDYQVYITRVSIVLNKELIETIYLINRDHLSYVLSIRIKKFIRN